MSNISWIFRKNMLLFIKIFLRQDWLMNNIDDYSKNNIDGYTITKSYINNNSDIDKYTKDEIINEMNILARSFDIVRLVSPCKCHIIRNASDSDSSDTSSTTSNCYDVWNVPYQCVNCTSARALLTSQTQSKLDTVDNDVFQITSRPVLVDGIPLVLEIVRHFSYTYNRYSSFSAKQKLINIIKTLNSQLLLDKETQAYNRDYLAEHLPNLLYTAKKTHQSNTALIHIQHLYDITQSEGSMAASGIICSLYSLLKQLFSDETDIGLIFVRYSPDTFFVLESKLDYKNFCRRIESLPDKAMPKHLLFNNKRLPFDINIACADLGNENINTESELFDILKTRLEDTQNTQK